MTGQDERHFLEFPGNETILLTEDEASVRALARYILKLLGYVVLEAAHGREAMEIAEAFADSIHLLVTDVIMPEISGLQLAERLRERRTEMKVLYLSGYSEDWLMQDTTSRLGTSFLQKPFSPTMLAQSVRKALDGSAAV